MEPLERKRGGQENGRAICSVPSKRETPTTSPVGKRAALEARKALNCQGGRAVWIHLFNEQKSRRSVETGFGNSERAS